MCLVFWGRDEKTHFAKFNHREFRVQKEIQFFLEMSAIEQLVKHNLLAHRNKHNDFWGEKSLLKRVIRNINQIGDTLGLKWHLFIDPFATFPSPHKHKQTTINNKTTTKQANKKYLGR